MQDKMKFIHQVFYGIVLSLFLSIPFNISAQVVIKDRMELQNKKTSLASTNGAYENFRFFIGYSGDITLDIKTSSRYYLEDWVLYEEDIGRIAAGRAIDDYNLGHFPQWTGFTFYFKNRKTGEKRYVGSSSHRCNLEQDYQGYSFLDVMSLSWEPDSTKLSFPPQRVMNCLKKDFTDPGNVHFSFDEKRWGYVKIERATKSYNYDLYLESPEQKLLAKNVGDKIHQTFRLGPYSLGEKMVFYIKSSHDPVKDIKMYGNKSFWKIRFEGGSDLLFNDLSISLGEGLMPSDPNGVEPYPLPYATIYGDTTYVYFTGRTNIGWDKKFPKDQKFDVWINEEGKQYGTLVSKDGKQRGDYLTNVTQPVLYLTKTVDELGFEPGFSSPDIFAKTKLKDPYPPYEIEGYERMSLRREALKVGFEKDPISPGNKTLIKPYFEYRDGEQQYFEEGHQFYSVAIIKGKKYGHLETADGKNIGNGGNYLSPGIKFVANPDIDQESAVVWIYVGTDITFDRSFELLSMNSGFTSNMEAPSTSQDSLFDYTKQQKKLVEYLKTQGDEELIQYIRLPKNKADSSAGLPQSASSISTSSEEGETWYMIGYGRLEFGEPEGNEILLGESKYYAARWKNPSQKNEIVIEEVAAGTDGKPSEPSGLVPNAFSDYPIEVISGGKSGVYWEKKWASIDSNTGSISSGDLPSGMVRVIGRYWEKGKDYKVKLKAEAAGSSGELKIEVVKPNQLGNKYGKARTVLDEVIDMDSVIIANAGKYGVPPQLIKGHIDKESYAKNFGGSVGWGFTPGYLYEAYNTEFKIRSAKRDYAINNDAPYHWFESPYKVIESSMGTGESVPSHLYLEKLIYPKSPQTIWDMVKKYSHLKGKPSEGGWPQYGQLENSGKMKFIYGAPKKIYSEILGGLKRDYSGDSLYTIARDTMAKYLKNEWRGGLKNMYAQTRIASSYGPLQLLYTTSRDYNYPIKRKSGKLAARPEDLSELAVHFKVVMLLYQTHLQNQVTKKVNWEKGYEKSWYQAVDKWNPYAPRYEEKVFQFMNLYLPQTN
ncbi:hypothetical protein [Fodinibius saliphilus]|uniref:hypothetical protein n=1 Tax=Fodinibius saliphilus TaxID=1920650 RepID=UPI001107F59A|nr:hypothetical protein [Fodinibius saliphilus]